MNLIEVMFSVMIFLLTIASTSLAFTTVIKNEMKLEDSLKHSMRVLDTDRKLREKVRSIDIPYWENIEKQIDFKIRSGFFNEDEIYIEGIETKRNKNGKADSLSIRWKSGNKIYETVERLNVRQVTGERF